MSSVPKYDEMMNPLLEALHALGGQATLKEMSAEVATIMSLTEAQVSQPHNERRQQTELEYRLGWTRTYLKKYGLLKNPRPGLWALTKKGQKTKQVDPQEVVRFVKRGDKSQQQEATKEAPKPRRTELPLETTEPRSLSPHLQDYGDARVFLRVADGIPYNHYRLLWNGIRESSGTVQDPTDWSDPDTWIPRRLEEPAQELAMRLWTESRRRIYVRAVHYVWMFVQRHELAERDKEDRIVMTDRGRKFIEGDKSVVASIDRYEGMFVIMAALGHDGASRLVELKPAFASFCRTYTRVASDRVIDSYLRSRLNNLVTRGLVTHEQPHFRLTRAGRAYLDHHRGLVEQFETNDGEETETEAEDTKTVQVETPVSDKMQEPDQEEQQTSLASDAVVESPSVAELFHRVESLLPSLREVTTVPPEMIVSEAIRIMKQNRLSHLPVTAGRMVLGIFSHRSFAERLMRLGTTSQFVGDWPVDEFMEPLRYHHRSDSWQTILDALDEQQAVLVGNPMDLEGIITPMDAVKYLQQISSPFVMIAEIEQSLRRIIRARVNQQELRELVERSLSNSYPQENMPYELTEMTFNDYMLLVTTRDNWEYFAPVFGNTEWARQQVNSKLIQTRQLRNDIFHFRRELTGKDRTRLAEFRNWLENKARAYEARQRE